MANDALSNMLRNNINRNLCFIPTGTCNDYSRNFGYKSFKNSIKIIKENNIVKKTVYKIILTGFLFRIIIIFL